MGRGGTGGIVPPHMRAFAPRLVRRSVSTATERARRSLSAVAAVLTSPDLRRLQIAGAAGAIGGWAYWVVVSLYAYDARRRRRPSASSPALRLARSRSPPPSRASSPTASRAGACCSSPTRTRAVSLLSRPRSTPHDGPPPVVIAFVVLFAVAGSAFRPALSALLPTLARTPEELTAANVTASAIESASWFAGPALGGLVVAAAGTAWGFLPRAACLAVSALFIFLIRCTTRSGGRSAAAETGEGMLAQAADGMKAIAQYGSWPCSSGSSRRRPSSRARRACCRRAREVGARRRRGHGRLPERRRGRSARHRLGRLARPRRHAAASRRVFGARDPRSGASR